MRSPWATELDRQAWLEREDDAPEVFEHMPRLPCGCPLDSECDGYHALTYFE